MIMKTATAAFLLALALSSPALAVLRPRVPHRTPPPAGGGYTFIVIDDSIRKAARTSVPAPR